MEFARNLSKNFNNFKYNKFNPSVNEWVNSTYSFESGWDKKNSNLLNNKLSYILINSYFNMKFHMKKKVLYRKKLVNRLSHLSVKRIFVSIPEFKHSLRNLNILIYIFNKEEMLLLRKIKKLQSLYKHNLNSDFLKNNISNIEKINENSLSNNIDNKFINKFIVNSRYIGIKNILKIRYYKIFLYKNYLTRLYFNKYMFNFNSLFYLQKILYNIYKTQVNINIINLKYLYLDNSIFVDAITRKLKDRKKKVLRVLRKALILPKIPIIDHLLLINKKIAINFFNSVKQQSMFITFNNIKNIKNIKRSIYESMKNTHVIGIRLEGKGRLTRRLTASRAVFKVAYLGNLRNIISSFQGFSSVTNKGFEKSNINYVNMNSNNRNGSFGIKSWQNTM